MNEDEYTWEEIKQIVSGSEYANDIVDDIIKVKVPRLIELDVIEYTHALLNGGYLFFRQN